MTGLINLASFSEAGAQPFFTLVKKPDMFDGENTEVSKQLCVILSVIGQTTSCWCSHISDNWIVNNSPILTAIKKKTLLCLFNKEQY